MAMNRRNVLIGLGTVAAGGGAVLGTGAFSTVEAERTVSIETSGDSGAVVQFSTSSNIGGSNGDTIQFQESDINADAVTEYTDALTITIPDSTTGTTYTVDLTDGSDNDIHFTSSEGTQKTSSDPDFQLVGGNSDPLSFDTTGGDDSTSLDVVVNTLDTTGDGTSISVSTLKVTVTDTT